MAKCFFFLFLFCCGALAQTTTFPNIGYLGCGYDLIFGNPHVTNPVKAPDPGYRQLVFNLSIYSGDTTPDQKYSIPMGTQVELCSSCSFEFEIGSFSGINDYQNSLSESIGADFGAWGARFSASEDFKNIQDSTSSLRDAFTESLAACCVYKSKLQTFRPPPLSEGFRAAVSQMPANYNSPSSYFFATFLDAFGTHVTTAITMGGKLGQRSKFSANSWSRLSSSNLDWKESALYSALLVSAAAWKLTSVQRQQAVSFSSFTSEQKLFNIGGEVPADENLTSWIAAAKQSPMPLSAQLATLDTLLTSDNFPEDAAINNKRAALAAAIEDYCNVLVLKGLIASCQPPPEDEPFPLPSIYGGQYQVDDCQLTNVVNPYTGHMNCKQGYNPHYVASIEFPNNCYSLQYICLLEDQSTDPLRFYGGAYQMDTRGPVFPNPLTPFGESSCPGGFSSVQLAQVKWDDRTSELFGCFNMSVPLESIPYAGGYQIPDSGAPNDVVNNMYTHSTSCPEGFWAYKVGRIMTPDHPSYVGASMYACLSNVFNFTV